MARSRSTTARAIRLAAASSVVALAACGDGTAPRASAPRFLAIRDAAQRSAVWEYRRDGAGAVTPDSLTFVRAMTRAPDGRIAVVAWMPPALDGVVIEYAADGRTLRSFPLPGARGGEIAYSRDGGRLAWYVWGEDLLAPDSLRVADAGSTTARVVASRPGRGGPSNPDPAPLGWTPQGEIVFGPPATLQAVDPATGEAHVLLQDAYDVRDYDWSRDGRIAFAGRPTAASFAGVYFQQSAGTPPIGLMRADESAAMVRWAPDGRRIATSAMVQLDVEGSSGVVWFARVLDILPVDGDAGRRFTGVSMAELHGWTADGRGVLFSGIPISQLDVFGSNSQDVFLATASGGTPRNLTNTPGIDERSVTILP